MTVAFWAALAVARVVGVAVAALAVATFRRPIATARRWSRRKLSRAGLQKRSASGPLGTLTWWSGGQGPVVVLLHGAGDHAGTWALAAPALVADHRVVVPDLPGHGDSSPPDGPLTLAQIVDGLSAVLDHEAPGTRVALVGNSMGGWVALLFAVQHPGRVRHLVLENATGIRGEGSPLELVPTSCAQAQDLADKVLGAAARPLPAFVLDDMIRELSRGAVARLLESDWERFLLDGRLGEIAAPVDLIWGERDGILPLAMAERTAAQLHDARLHVVPGGGHILHRDRAADFSDVLARVLASRVSA
jgi:pimeloyl-ACP methyl ester carboxylesterase